ncbi:MAG: DMT family transporter [Dehalococcoidia bacterium]
MPIGALLLVLGAAVFHASWNYAAKGARGGLGFAAATVACSVLFFLPLTIVLAVVLRGEFGPEALAFMLVSGCLHTLYFHVLTEGYRRGDLSVVYPLSRGTGPIFTVIGAVILLEERPAPIAVVGICLIVAGVIIISLPREVELKHAAPSIAFALGTGLCIAMYSLWDKNAVDDIPPVLYGLGIDISRMIVLAPILLASATVRSDALDAWTAHRRATIIIGALTPAAYLMVLVAFTLAPVSYVAPAREVSILFGAAMGLGLMGEAYPVQRLAGAAAIVAGLVAVSLG